MNREVIGAACATALAAGLLGLAGAPASAAGPEQNYLVVGPQSGGTASAQAHVKAAGGTVVAAYDQIGVVVATSTAPDFASRVGGGLQVASTEGLGTPLDDEETTAVDPAALTPGDPTAEPLWGLQWDMTQIDVDDAHAVTTGDSSIVVGVLDSGISPTHPDLASQIAADHGMPITNNSYFIDPWEFNCVNDPRQRPVWLAVQRAIAYSTAKGALTIASAGNSNVDLAHTFTDSHSPNDGSYPVEDRTITGACRDLPAEAPGVMTVSAVGPAELKSYYSSYGIGVVDVAAPGGDSRWRNPAVSNPADAILSTTYNAATGVNGWGYKQGTSMASPHAAGVAALALSANPGLSAGQLSALVESQATPLPCPEGVYDPRPGLPQYQAECQGGARNGFYGARNVDALAVVD